MEIAPDRRFRLMPQLFQHVRLQFAGLLVLGVGKNHRVHDLGHPAVFPFFQIRPGFGHDGIGPAHEFHVPRNPFSPR
jgi:hypothetical protein